MYSDTANKNVLESIDYWFQYFLHAASLVDLHFDGISPDPIDVFHKFVDRQLPVEKVEEFQKTWIKKLQESGKFHDLDSIDLMPLRIAILIAGIPKTHSGNKKAVKREIEQIFEHFDWGLERLGINSKELDSLWAEYRGQWMYIKD